MFELRVSITNLIRFPPNIVQNHKSSPYDLCPIFSIFWRFLLLFFLYLLKIASSFFPPALESHNFLWVYKKSIRVLYFFFFDHIMRPISQLHKTNWLSRGVISI